MTPMHKSLFAGSCFLALLIPSIGSSQERPLSQQQTAAPLSTSEAPAQQQVTRENNPNYPTRNPFYFEGKIDYELLGIDEPANAWEYMQRGIHRQDDQENYRGAMQDYRRALDLNSTENGTCQIVTAVPENFNTLDPAPCIFTLRLRLAYLLIHDEPEESIRLFREVLKIDPLRLEVHFLIAEAFEFLAEETADEQEQTELYWKAIEELGAELVLTPPVDDPGLSPDQANNAHTHWLLAEIYEKLDEYNEAIEALENYLRATRWHSDVLPWRIQLARKKIEEFRDRPAKKELAGHGVAPPVPRRARVRATPRPQ